MKQTVSSRKMCSLKVEWDFSSSKEEHAREEQESRCRSGYLIVQSKLRKNRKCGGLGFRVNGNKN